MSVQLPCSLRSLRSFRTKSYGASAGIGIRTVPVRGLCNATYEMSTGYGLTIFKTLSNFSRNQIVEAAEPVNPYENVTVASCLRREPSRRPHGKGDTGRIRARYGLRRPIASQMWTRHYMQALYTEKFPNVPTKLRKSIMGGGEFPAPSGYASAHAGPTLWNIFFLCATLQQHRFVRFSCLLGDPYCGAPINFVNIFLLKVIFLPICFRKISQEVQVQICLTIIMIYILCYLSGALRKQGTRKVGTSFCAMREIVPYGSLYKIWEFEEKNYHSEIRPISSKRRDPVALWNVQKPTNVQTHTLFCAKNKQNENHRGQLPPWRRHGFTSTNFCTLKLDHWGQFSTRGHKAGGQN